MQKAATSTNQTQQLQQLKENFYLQGGHISSVTSVRYSSHGKSIISCGLDCDIRIWDIDSMKCISILKGHNSFVHDAVFSPDSHLIVSGSQDCTIKVWDLESKLCIHTLKGHKLQVRSVAFSPNGQYLVSGSEDKTVLIWDIDSMELFQTLNGHTDGVLSVSFSMDSERVISCSQDSTIKIWVVDRVGPIATLNEHNSSVYSAVYSPDGKMIVSGSEDANIKLWDANSFKCIQTLQGHNQTVFCVQFSPDNSKIVSCSADKTVKLWDVNSFSCLQTFKGHYLDVYSVSFSSNGQQIVSSSRDNTIKIQNMENSENNFTIVQKICSGAENSIYLSQDHQIIYAYNQTDRCINSWNIKTKQLLNQLYFPFWSCLCLRALNNSPVLLLYANSYLKFWNLESNSCVKEILLQVIPTGLAISEDDQFLAFFINKQLQIWNAQSKKLIGILKHKFFQCNYNILFSQDGNQLLCIDGKMMKLFDFHSRKLLKQFLIKSIKNQINYQISSCGQKVYVSIDNQNLQIWNLKSRRLLCNRVIKQHQLIQYKGLSRMLFTANKEVGTIQIWKLQSPKPFISQNIPIINLKSSIFIQDNQFIVSNQNELGVYEINRGGEVEV